MSGPLRWRRRGAAPEPSSGTAELPSQQPAGGSAGDLHFQRAHRQQPLAFERGSATTILLNRLSPEDIAAIEARIAEDASTHDYYRAAAPSEQRHLLLTLGIHYGVDVVARKTGLPTVQPPEHIHTMARGPTAAAGGLYEADLVMDAVLSAGGDPSSIGAGLDFGCSSGRVLRVLATAYPGAEWHGCDPNGPAVEWAAQALPGARYFQSANEPPLALPDGSLDLAYGISIWSHFAPELGLRWLEEMRRILRPGGYLVMTTHGSTSLALHEAEGLRSLDQLREIVHALHAHGFWYAPEFGEDGDWGVVNPDWGTAFLSPEWLLTHACPRWRILEFASGRNAANQDVYVLQRV